MPEHDLTERLIEQLKPIMETMRGRIETELTDRDRAAIAHALAEAVTAGARVAYANLAANAVELGMDLPESFSLKGLRPPNFWPPED
jgi:hypothetical protein